MKRNHEEIILEQFTQQAAPFARHHASDEELLSLMVQFTGLADSNEILDVACGPGIVSCAFAPRVRHVTGLDLVPAMLVQAEKLRRTKGHLNISWQEGRATELPFDSERFDAVVTRFSFHHFAEPAVCLREMQRVCKPQGTIMVMDVAPETSKRAAYDELEKLRDPSHTSALTESEFLDLGEQLGLRHERTMSYALKADLEKLLAASFPPDGNSDLIRQRLQEDIRAGTDRCGILPQMEDGRMVFYFPVKAFVWTR